MSVLGGVGEEGVPVGVPRHVLKLAALCTAACCSHVQKGRKIFFLFPTEQKPVLNILFDFARQHHTILGKVKGPRFCLALPP